MTECIYTLCSCCCSLCHSVSVLSCVDVIQSSSYVLRVVIWDITKRRGESARESERQYQRPLACTIKNYLFFKLGISDCGSFVDAYFHPATSMDRLQVVNCTDTIKNLVVFLTNVIKGDN